MAEHQVKRAVLRDALDLLRQEGIIDRLQGYGSYSLAVPRIDDVEHYQGIGHVPHTGVWSTISRTTVLSRKDVRTPDAVRALLPDCGDRCLQFEYIAHSPTEPLGLSTLYFRYPEGDAVAAGHIGADFWEFMVRSGLKVGASKISIGAGTADSLTADILGLSVGAPLVVVERVIYTMTGRPYAISFLRLRGDRMQIGMFTPAPGYSAS